MSRRVFVGQDFESEPEMLARLFPQYGVAGDGYVGAYEAPPQIVGGYGEPQIVGASVQQEEMDTDEFFDEWLPLTGESGTSIAAGATSDFELKPTRLARPGELVLDSGIASNLIMTSLTIGGHPVFLKTGSVPCSMFSHLAIVRRLMSKTASPGQPINFTLKNIHASAAQVVYGVWLCKAVKP